MAERILITGATSGLGRHLITLLQALAPAALAATWHQRPPLPIPGVSWHRCDVSDLAALAALLAATAPTHLYHLAGSADAAQPVAMWQTNVTGTCHLLAALRALPIPPRVLLVGSAAMLPELPPTHAGWNETVVPQPTSFYGLSRHTQLELGRLASQDWGLPIYLCRPFNLIGPGLGATMAPAALAHRVLALPAGTATTMDVRQAEAVRDFVDLRDLARALPLILAHGQPGFPYHMGTGHGVSIAQLVMELADLTGRQLTVVPAAPPATGVRSSIMRSIADSSALRRDTGWEPTISLRQSLADLLAALPPTPPA